MKKTLFSLAAATALAISAAMPSAMADTISPTTVISGCDIGNLTEITNVFDYSFNNPSDVVGDIIIPTTVITNTNATVLNVIHNIVNVKVNVDGNSIADMAENIRETIINKFNNNI
ncbi:MAG: hypothetical protein ACI4SS_01340 [Clostridia bacterium]